MVEPIRLAPFATVWHTILSDAGKYI
jgi:hypothetical protein